MELQREEADMELQKEEAERELQRRKVVGGLERKEAEVPPCLRCNTCPFHGRKNHLTLLPSSPPPKMWPVLCGVAEGGGQHGAAMGRGGYGVARRACCIIFFS